MLGSGSHMILRVAVVCASLARTLLPDVSAAGLVSRISSTYDSGATTMSLELSDITV